MTMAKTPTKKSETTTSAATRRVSIADWIRTDPSMWFDPSNYRGCRVRKASARISAGHWTGGNDRWVGNDEMSAPRVFRALETRVDRDGRPMPLSIHFVIESDGDTWQFADADTVTYHASEVNEESFGTEITNPGFPPVKRGVARETLIHEVHGRQVKQLSFTRPQLDSWVRLNEELAKRFDIPRVVPGVIVGRNADGSPIFDVASDKLSRANLRDFSGAGEHLHFSTKKLDGGTQLSRALVEAGWGYWSIDAAER